MRPHQDPETLPFTPEWRARIEALARSQDPFFQGAQWLLDILDTQPANTQPPATPGASSSPRKDIP